MNLTETITEKYGPDFGIEQMFGKILRSKTGKAWIAFNRLSVEIWILGKSQDDRIRGHGIYISSQLHREYIYKRNSYHRTPAKH